MTGVKDETICAAGGTSEQLQGWCMSLDSSDDSQYLIYGVCDSDETTGTAIHFPNTPNPYDLPDGVHMSVRSARADAAGNGQWVSTDPDSNRIRFNVFGDGIRMEDATGPLGKITYCLTTDFPSLGSTAYEIDVKPSGEIEDEGFKTSCFTDPETETL